MDACECHHFFIASDLPADAGHEKVADHVARFDMHLVPFADPRDIYGVHLKFDLRCTVFIDLRIGFLLRIGKAFIRVFFLNFLDRAVFCGIARYNGLGIAGTAVVR